MQGNNQFLIPSFWLYIKNKKIVPITQMYPKEAILDSLDWIRYPNCCVFSNPIKAITVL